MYKQCFPKNHVPVVLSSAQIEAFKALMGAQPAQGAEGSTTPGVSNLCSPDAECLSVDVTADELHIMSKRLKRHKSPGEDGVLAEMIKEWW